MEAQGQKQPLGGLLQGFRVLRRTREHFREFQTPWKSMQLVPFVRMVIRNDPQGIKPPLQNGLSPVADGPESFRLVTIPPAVFVESTLKRRLDFALTAPKAADLCDGRVQWHRDASTTTSYVPGPEEKREASEQQGRPEKFASGSFFYPWLIAS